ncbi:hypothetical protein MLC59_07640 [Marinobacter bryozoorum]|uniref:hypothetical protein n=1 Tax=Marinobacter bryozoorum TaxID=256324 RepID=UPI002005731E|nr:hypothetical protein [Marinobacter bryozoorum]MCK7544038.1 hypothetical protein [Marinobacter bryozoorum]
MYLLMLIKKVAISGLLFLSLTLFPFHASASAPFLAFSDLRNGPSSGLDDGQGSGVIVTLWGQGLGNSQGDSNVYFRSSSGDILDVAHVYYWKAADGQLPSGPANLYESHGMQEIALSIPASADGDGELFVEVDGQESNRLPFTVRQGGIYHVKAGGKDGANGSWQEPFATAAFAVNAVPAGSTIYVHGVDTGSFNSPSARAIYWNNGDASSTQDAQFAVTAYPGYQPKAIAQRAIESYRTEGWVVSKYDVYASNYLSVDSNGQPAGGVISNVPRATYGIQTSRNGRVVGNRIGDIPGGCASQAQGAILGNKDWIGNNKIYGNEIYDYGCEGSNKLHHTTYLSIRANDNPIVEPWEWAYNYLHGNHAKFGIHNYDEGTGCGDISGPLRIHHNVIVEQGGAGISIGSTCGWSMDVFIEDNVLIDVGLPAGWDGVDSSDLTAAESGGIALRDGGNGLYGDYIIRNNLVYNWATPEQSRGGLGCLSFNADGDNIDVVWMNNICYSDYSFPFVDSGFRAENKLDNVQGSNNIWYLATGGSDYSVPGWDNSAVKADPLLTISGSKVEVASQSPVFGNGVSAQNVNAPSSMMTQYLRTSDQFVDRDIYGRVRTGSGTDIGPVTESLDNAVAAPNPPTSILVE